MWSELPEDLQDKILRKAALRFVSEFRRERQVPVDLRPALLRDADFNSWASVTQRIVIERSRHAIEGHGPRDVLTVSFSNCVDEDWFGFEGNRDRFGYLVPGLGFDRDAVCTVMDFKRSWTDVIKIRLVFGDDGFDVQDYFQLALTRQIDGREEVVFVRNFYILGRREKEAFARRLEEELRLRRRVVAGCDEFTVA